MVCLHSHCDEVKINKKMLKENSFLKYRRILKY